MTLGEKISALRNQHEMSQGDLAEKMNVSRQSISKWETGKSMPDMSYLSELCAALQINVNELLAGERISVADYSVKAEETIMALMEETQKTKKANWIQAIIGLVLVVLAFLLMMGITERGAKGIFQYPMYMIDLPSMILDLLFAVGVLLLSGAKDKVARLSVLNQTLIPIGVSITLVTAIIILATLDDIAYLGPNLAVAILSLLYVVIAKIVVVILLERSKTGDVAKM